MSGEQAYDKLFKVLLLGNANVGKTCLLRRFRTGEFEVDNDATIGVEFWTKDVIYRGKFNEYKIRLQIWDTSGQERFKAITKQYYSGAHGVLIVYDITDSASFEAANEWITNVEQYANSNAAIILLGNKCDLESQRQVSKQEASEFAESKGIKFIETSAKNADNVEEAFTSMTKAMKDASSLAVSRPGDLGGPKLGQGVPLERRTSCYYC